MKKQAGRDLQQTAQPVLTLPVNVAEAVLAKQADL
jgi:hypothetical protein